VSEPANFLAPMADGQLFEHGTARRSGIDCRYPTGRDSD
jgi:hypothetical protein